VRGGGDCAAEECDVIVHGFGISVLLLFGFIAGALSGFYHVHWMSKKHGGWIAGNGKA